MNIFNIIGPIMIGPSSSHTAGAARIGRVASSLLGNSISEARILFSGSFATTYKGHGTDRAVVGGLLGYLPSDERIRTSLAEAAKKKINISFGITDLAEYHPNTMLLELTNKDGITLKVIASSVGGGSIVIKKIDDYAVEFNAECNTLIIPHEDRKGVIAETAEVLARNNINIAGMKVFRSERGGKAMMVIETDEKIGQDILDRLNRQKYVYKSIYLEPVNI
jgi:L-serine dehydratase